MLRITWPLPCRIPVNSGSGWNLTPAKSMSAVILNSPMGFCASLVIRSSAVAMLVSIDVTVTSIFRVKPLIKASPVVEMVIVAVPSVTPVSTVPSTFTTAGLLETIETSRFIVEKRPPTSALVPRKKSGKSFIETKSPSNGTFIPFNTG